MRKIGYYKPLSGDDKQRIEATLQAFGTVKVYREQDKGLSKSTRQSREFMLGGLKRDKGGVVFVPSRDHAATDADDFAVFCAMLEQCTACLFVAGKRVDLREVIEASDLTPTELARRVSMEWKHVAFRYANRGGHGGKKNPLPPQNVPKVAPRNFHKRRVMTPAQVEKARTLRDKGFTPTEIAKAFEVAGNTVRVALRAA